MVIAISSSTFSVSSHFLQRISPITFYCNPAVSSPKMLFRSSAAFPLSSHPMSQTLLYLSAHSIELQSSDDCWKQRNIHKRRFSGVVQATEVSQSGSIDSPMMQAMEKKIKEQLDADVVIVKDAYGDGRHVSIDVVSKAFEGQSSLNRQRMVYKAIWEELQSTVHAVDQMTTKTPTEVDAEN
ncbi:protein BOLA4, chloroplastic/mitochondrial-like [Curcuma longa]|uniref:protein BOLA4, chloroplastic/mitochondrial-like n=1 Tax=Curcuma longa TaxID=136217 RepID=UPI003D9EFDC0